METTLIIIATLVCWILVGTIVEFLYIRYNSDPDHDTDDITKVGIRCISNLTTIKIIFQYMPGYFAGSFLYCVIGIWSVFRIPVRLLGAIISTSKNKKTTNEVDELEL